jgi:DNA-binding transcriptional LysR family regulator
MNLQQLRYLVAAADAGSLSGAAREERVSQPVVSRALHNLERELHVPLFRRHGRRLVLTDAGEAVVASARRALDAVEDVHRTARRSAHDGELVVVSTPTNSTLMTPIFTSYLHRAPGASLRLCRAAEMDEAIRMVDTGAADLAFGDIEGRTDTETLHFRALWDVDVVVVAPIGSGLPPTLPRAQLAEVPLVLPPNHSERRKLIDGLVSDAGGALPSPVLATDERSAWIASAQQGIGAFLSYQATAGEVDQVEMIELDPPLRTVVGFVHRRSGLSPDAETFLRQAQEFTPPAGCQAHV